MAVGSRDEVLVSGSGRRFILLCQESRPGSGPTLAPIYYCMAVGSGMMYWFQAAVGDLFSSAKSLDQVRDPHWLLFNV